MHTLLSSPDRHCQRLIQILQDIVDVFYAYAQANRFRSNSREPLLFGRHLAMRGGRRVARKRFCVSQIDQSLEQPKSIVKASSTVDTASN
jgi:hypothetical protein